MKLREEEFYEQYHQHGGTTIIPTEIFNELYDDATEEIERLNNIIEKTESMLKRLMKEQEYCYKKYPENWKERTGVSNTWLTSRDCYWSALNYLKKLKGSGKE